MASDTPASPGQTPKKKPAAKPRKAKAKVNGAAEAPAAAAAEPHPAKTPPKPAAKPQTAAPKPAETDDFPVPDASEFSRNMIEITKRSQSLVREFLSRSHEGIDTHPIDPLNVSRAFLDLGRSMMQHPSTLLEAQNRFWHSQVALWQNAIKRLWGYDTEPLVDSARDKRFRHDDWKNNAIFDYIKQSYLLTAGWLQETVAQAEGLDDKTRLKINFYTKQFADAIAPSNFILTNPEVLRETLKTNGENLLRGLNHMLEDLEGGDGKKLSIKQTDMNFYKVGENIGTAKGKVVYRNELMELIQYDPTTKEVFRRPLLIFPPWINKFYILDLQPENSFVKWATEHGHTVFVVSWVNPDARLAQKTFESYMFEGVLDALDAVEKATGEKEVNAIGYCIGGTLLASSLAYMAQKGDDRIKSATFFAAQVDFTEAGELQVFIDDEQLHTLEQRMRKSGGYLDGADMAQTFNMLRANDLIWSYVVNNYLMGREPIRFDLLYWNADTTRMPSLMHLFYLRECYLNNHLAKGEMVLGGETLNLHKVKTPVFLQSAKDDHIAPFNSVYKATKLFGGPVKFIIAGSGHIAGVINPPSANKYQYWTNDDVSGSIEDWRAKSVEHPGSWWPYWQEWIAGQSGDKVPARTPGDGKLKPICDAPGSYVLVKASD